MYIRLMYARRDTYNSEITPELYYLTWLGHIWQGRMRSTVGHWTRGAFNRPWKRLWKRMGLVHTELHGVQSELCELHSGMFCVYHTLVYVLYRWILMGCWLCTACLLSTYIWWWRLLRLYVDVVCMVWMYSHSRTASLHVRQGHQSIGYWYVMYE